jgi:hypothetical protein
MAADLRVSLRAVSPCPTAPSRHVQYEGIINCTKILRIGGDDMQVPLPRAEGNRHIDHIGVARPAAQQAHSPGDGIVQGNNLGALVAEQRGDPRLPRSGAPHLSHDACGHRDLPVTPVDLLQQSLHPPAATLDRDESSGIESDGAAHSTPSARRAHA